MSQCDNLLVVVFMYNWGQPGDYATPICLTFFMVGFVDYTDKHFPKEDLHHEGVLRCIVSKYT